MYDNPVWVCVLDRKLTDLNPRSTGYEYCDRRKYQPACHVNNPLIHYVESGKGYVIINGKNYPVKAGQLFIVMPKDLCRWYPDPDDPWFYRWISFDGALSENFAALPPVLDYPPDIFRAANATESFDGVREYIIAGLLFKLYADLFPEVPTVNTHVENIKTLIDSNYMYDISIAQIAKTLNRDPRYLTTLFKKKTGKTIHEYIVHIRMREALEYIKNGTSITDTAMLCGYSDISNFSKNFKKYYGVSPTKKRN